MHYTAAGPPLRRQCTAPRREEALIFGVLTVAIGIFADRTGTAPKKMLWLSERGNPSFV
jgi:hypothetical protein